MDNTILKLNEIIKSNSVAFDSLQSELFKTIQKLELAKNYLQTIQKITKNKKFLFSQNYSYDDILKTINADCRYCLNKLK